jgi:carboxyl-terminal processing protease
LTALQVKKVQVRKHMYQTKSDTSILRLTGPIIIILGAILLVAGGAFAAGYAVANSNNHSEGMQVFWEAWTLVENEFYFDKPSETDRIHGAINGMLSAYKDRFTFLMPPDLAQKNEQVMQGQDGGIGATVQMSKEGELVIVEAMIGKPAAEAGLQAGDVIVAVNGEDIKGLTLQDIVEKIHGPLGTSVSLELKRPGANTLLTFTVMRQQINTYSKMLKGGIAYVSLSIFSQQAADELSAELETLLKQQPSALILDLRDNPGGYLDQALNIADLFLTEGPIASEKESSGLSKDFSADTGDLAEQVPLIVLVNNNSASASEIVAGALQDRQRGVLIGQHTYGKGTVQTIHTLSDKSQLRITHGAWYTPNKTPIQSSSGEHLGLAPNVLVPLADPASAAGDPIQPADQLADPTLNAAIEYIKAHYWRPF